MDDFSGLYNIRDAHKLDEAFVISTFLRGIYYGETFFSETPKEIFMKHYKLVARSLIGSNQVKVKIACLPDDPETIIGFSVLSNDFKTVNFVFVKKKWRNKGIARGLVPKGFEYVVPQHVTNIGKSILSKYKTKHNPFF